MVFSEQSRAREFGVRAVFTSKVHARQQTRETGLAVVRATDNLKRNVPARANETHRPPDFQKMLAETTAVGLCKP